VSEIKVARQGYLILLDYNYCDVRRQQPKVVCRTFLGCCTYISGNCLPYLANWSLPPTANS